MSTVNIRRLSDPDILKEIAPVHLLALVEDDRDFLAGKGASLPPAGDGAEIDYEALAKVFASPDDIPPALVEKFHLVNQMSDKDAMDRILDEVRVRRPTLEFAADSSPADVAAQLLVKDKRLFQEIYAEHAVTKARSFTYFVSGKKMSSFEVPKDLSGLEGSLNDWYEKHRRKRTARIFWRQDDSEVWFFVRHGEPMKREGSIGLKDNESGSTIYQPEKHDLVIYNWEMGELSVHADCKNEPDLFRKEFGRHLFKDPDYFPVDGPKFRLDPLKTAGRAALVCKDIEGLANITLKQIEFITRGALWERESHLADDIFSVFEARGFVIPDTTEIRQAKFAVRFKDNARPRTVTIRPSNYAYYGQDDDAILVEKWLSARGFIVKNEAQDEDEDGSLEQS